MSSGCALVASPFGALSGPADFVRDQVAYNNTTDSLVLGWRNHVWSKKAWYQHEEMFCGHAYQKDLGKGFRAGYVSVANGEGGCPPILPPREYWSWRYQSPEGQAKAAAWFEGFPLGAAAAEKDGIDNWGYIQTSYTAGSKSPQAREYYKEYQRMKAAGEIPSEEVPADAGGLEFLDPPPAATGEGLPVPATPNPANPTSNELPLPGPKVVPPKLNDESRVPSQGRHTVTQANMPAQRTIQSTPVPAPAPLPKPAPFKVIDTTPKVKFGNASPVHDASHDAADLPPTPPAVLRQTPRPPAETPPRARVRGVRETTDIPTETDPVAKVEKTDEAESAPAPVPSWWQPARQLALVYGADEDTDQAPAPEEATPAPSPTAQNPFAERLAQRLDSITGARR